MDRTFFGLSRGVAHTFALIVGFLAILIIIPMVGNKVSKIVGKTPIGILNHLAGGIVGIGIAAILMSYLFLIADNVFQETKRTVTIRPFAILRCCMTM